jgi:hypothetical protein
VHLGDLTELEQDRVLALVDDKRAARKMTAATIRPTMVAMTLFMGGPYLASRPRAPALGRGSAGTGSAGRTTGGRTVAASPEGCCISLSNGR